MTKPPSTRTFRALLLGLAALALGARPSAAIVLHVPRNYPSLERAIEASEPGDRISLPAGAFPVGTLVTHDLTIRGRRGTVLVAADPAVPHFIVEPGARLSLRTLRVSGSVEAPASIVGRGGSLDATRVDLVDGYRGVYGNFEAVSMRQGIVSGMQWNGIVLLNPREVLVAGETVSDSIQAGIYIDESYEPYSDPVVSIFNTTIAGNQGPGIYFVGPYSKFYVTHSTIDANGIAGIMLENPGFVTLDHDEVTNTVPSAQGQYGDGIVAVTDAPQCLGTITLTNTTVHDNNVGVGNFSSCIDIWSDVFAPNTSYNMEMEPFPGGAPVFNHPPGSGDVTCPPDTHCKVATAGISPPNAINP